LQVNTSVNTSMSILLAEITSKTPTLAVISKKKYKALFILLQIVANQYYYLLTSISYKYKHYQTFLISKGQ